MIAVIVAQLAQLTPDVIGDQSKTSLGVSLIALLLIVREFLSYLKTRDKAGVTLADTCEIENALAISVLPILNRQTEILGELKQNGARQTAQADRMTFMLEENKEHLAAVRGGLHQANNTLTVVNGNVAELRRTNHK